MSYNLFLDDVRVPADIPPFRQLGWVIVRSYADFVKAIQERGLPEIVSFDHDLADEHYPFNEPQCGLKNGNRIPYEQYKEKTGYHCAQWMIDYCLDNQAKLPIFFVHSANPAGRDNINSLLNNFKRFQTQ